MTEPSTNLSIACIVAAGAAGQAKGRTLQPAATRGVNSPYPAHLKVRGAAVVRAEDVGRARVDASVLIPVGSDHDGIAVDRYGIAEGVARCSVGGRQLGQLSICGAAIGRAETYAEPESAPPSSSP